MRVLILTMLLMVSGGLLAAPSHRTSLEEAVSQARDRYQGRVLSADTDRRRGRETHNIKILTPEGRVRRYDVDVESGRKLKPQR